MAKKLGKVILFSAVVGATAAGVYHYLQGKKNASEEFDDFDDFDDLDDFDDDSEKESKRSYVALDSAKAFVSDTVVKAKDVASKVSSKIKEATAKKDDEYTDVTPSEDAEDKAADEKEVDDVDKSTEEFFDDDEA